MDGGGSPPETLHLTEIFLCSPNISNSPCLIFALRPELDTILGLSGGTAMENFIKNLQQTSHFNQEFNF